MSQVWSEINKVVNVHSPASHVASTSFLTDVVNMENYKKCTFLLMTGASAANTPAVKIYADDSSTGTTSTGMTAIAFKYRTQIASTGAETLAGGDVPSALIDATSTGFVLTTAKAGGVYIIDVDASTVAAAGTDYDHVALAVTTGAAGATALYGITAVLSEPRYPQAILQTAID